MSYLRRKIHNLTHPLLGRILMLHRVVENRSDGENRELEVTPQFLEQTIKDYCNQGYRFVSINEACDIIRRGRTENLFVCLTFDDGYSDNYTTALPLLKRLNIPFAVYVTTGFIDNQLPIWWYCSDSLGLKYDELIALDTEPLCTIGAHTVSHHRLDTLTVEKQYKEIVESKATLERWLGHPICHFSYPHGSYNKDSLHIVHDCDFQSALHTWGGSVRRGENLYLLPRIELRQL